MLMDCEEKRLLMQPTEPDPMMIVDAPVKQQVCKRHVFFVPGYDPIAPRRYRELYRREAMRQAAISGYEITVEGQTDRDGYYCWNTWSRIDGQETKAQIEFLTWDDIVKSSMNRSILSSYLVMIRTCWIYFASGAFFRLVQTRPHPMIAALYPVLMLLAQLEAGLLSAWGVWWMASALGPLPNWAGGVVGFAFMAWLMRWFYRNDGRVFAYYLINDYGFTARHKGRYPDALKARIDEFSDRIEAMCDTEVDEVLVVGHSSGAHIAVTAISEVLRRREGKAGPVISFLTIGQVIPMMSYLPKAKELRRDLNYLSQNENLCWIDISAPGDGGCFALADPVHVSGVAPPEPDKLWPKVISAAFTQTMSPEALAKTKWRFFRRHIQYLCAFDRPGSYEYFKITAGPKTLRDRFSWRGATASRKETPLSPYKDF